MLKVAYDECTVNQISVYKWYKLLIKIVIVFLI